MEELIDIEKIKESIEIVSSISPNVRRVPHNHINVIYMLREYMKENCKNYLEIGTYHGGSIITGMQSEYKCNFYGLDFYGAGLNGEFDKPGNQSVNDGVSIESTKISIEKLNKHNHFFELIQADSQLDLTFNILKEKLTDGVDLLLIDGCHTYNCVLRDFELYSKLVNKGGFICFDDYFFMEEVRQAVNDINFDEYEIVGNIKSCPENSSLDESLDPSLNSTFIVKKK